MRGLKGSHKGDGDKFGGKSCSGTGIGSCGHNCTAPNSEYTAYYSVCRYEYNNPLIMGFVSGVETGGLVLQLGRQDDQDLMF